MPIADNEWLYRSLRIPDDHYDPPELHHTSVDGNIKISRSAFNDRNKEPSVDIHSLLSKIEDAKHSPNDAVIKINHVDIKNINAENILKPPIRHHEVKPDKTDARPAHARIVSAPKFGTNTSEKKKWKAFQLLLADAASQYGWVFPPIITD